MKRFRSRIPRRNRIISLDKPETRVRIFLLILFGNLPALLFLPENIDFQHNDRDRPIFHQEFSSRTLTFIYFVHGYGATNSQFGDMIKYFEDDFSKYYVNKRPLFFDYFSKYLNESFSTDDVHHIEGGISTYAKDCFDQLLNSHPEGARVDIIAHSMGGLILREMLRNFRNELENKGIIIHKVATLGTPHLGTELATHPIKELAVNFMGQDWQSPVIKTISPASRFILQLNHEPERYMNGIKWFFLAGQSTEIINVLGQLLIYNGVACDGFVDSESALGLGLDVSGIKRAILPKNHYQLIFDPVNQDSYLCINKWLQTE